MTRIEHDARRVDTSFWPETCHGRWMSEEYEPGLVSVIIPTYNRAHFLVEAMDSVWEQTYRPIELIVVDDGSTDNTQQVVDEWSKKCAEDDQFELRYIYQENKGAPAARNLGLIESSGEYIQFLDSDDSLDATKLDRQVGHLMGHECGVVCSAWLVEQSGKTDAVRLRGWPPGDVYVFLLQHNMWTASPLHRRAVFLQCGGFDESFSYGQEPELHARLAAAGMRFHYIDAPLATYRVHDGKDRLTLNHKPEERRLQMGRYLAVFLATEPHSADRRRALARMLVRSGRSLLRSGLVADAHWCFNTGQQVDPGVGPQGSSLYRAMCRLVGPDVAERALGCLKRIAGVKDL